MRRRALVGEAGAFAASRKIPTVIVGLLAAVICVLGSATAGRTVQAAGRIQATLNGAGSRYLEVDSTVGPGLLPSNVVESVTGLSHVEVGLGVATAIDVWSGRRGGGDTVPAWGVEGGLTKAVKLVAGRWPGPGEAIVSASQVSRLGLDGPAGFLARTGEEYPIVGFYKPTGPFKDFGEGALIGHGPGMDGASRLMVLADSSVAASWVEEQTMGIIAASGSQNLEITSPVTLASLQSKLSSGFNQYAGGVFALILALGVGIIAIVVLTDVLMLRSDLGRRRALGATRGTIAALVTGRTLIPTIIGALTGSVVAVIVGHTTGTYPGTKFTLAVAVLCLLAGIVASLPPAAIAMAQDPVKALRTP
jgi:putative ABC transport system permease protein